MPTYIQPGVYVKEVDDKNRYIEPVGTTTAVFIGCTAKGPLDQPTPVLGWSDYTTQFGALEDTENPVAGSAFHAGDYMGLAVRAFYKNGGGKAYIIRVADSAFPPPDAQAYLQAFGALRTMPDINIILLPGQAWEGSGIGVIEEAINHCEQSNNAMVIFDPPPGKELNSTHDIHSMTLPTSSHACTYYPWPLVRNTFYHRVRNPTAQRRVLTSPAAFAAGAWVKTDKQRNVWQAPAGTQTTLSGISRLEFNPDDNAQSALNPEGINAIRRLPGMGNLVWGARTRATTAFPEWRYISVKRTAMFIQESISRGTQWAVFEPNDHPLWTGLRSSVENFMNDLFRKGAFQGEKTSDAYYVRCGLGETMTQNDINQRTVIVELGFAPLKPAEFVVLKISHKTG